MSASRPIQTLIECITMCPEYQAQNTMIDFCKSCSFGLEKVLDHFIPGQLLIDSLCHGINTNQNCSKTKQIKMMIFCKAEPYLIKSILFCAPSDGAFTILTV